MKQFQNLCKLYANFYRSQLFLHWNLILNIWTRFKQVIAKNQVDRRLNNRKNMSEMTNRGIISVLCTNLFMLKVITLKIFFFATLVYVHSEPKNVKSNTGIMRF